MAVSAIDTGIVNAAIAETYTKILETTQDQNMKNNSSAVGGTIALEKTLCPYLMKGELRNFHFFAWS